MKRIRVIVDRPLGSTHPKHPDMVYPINYGYVEGIIAPDGDYQDVYILGVSYPIKAFEGELIAIIKRKDDIEDKWVVANQQFSKEQIEKEVYFTEQYFDSEVILVK